MKTICTLIAAGAVALLATSPAAPMATPRLVGTVGPGFTISLKAHPRFGLGQDSDTPSLLVGG